MNFTIQDIQQYDNLTIMQVLLTQRKSFEYISGRTASKNKDIEIKRQMLFKGLR